MQKKSFSWGIITLLLIFFFPVGIFMIVKKVTTEHFNYAKNGKTLKTLGWILLCFAAIYLLMFMTGDLVTEDGGSIVGPILVVIFLFGGGGILSLIKGNQYIKKGAKYNRYVSIINTSSDLFIDNIAAAYPTSFEEAAKDLQSMLDDGYFMNSYIDLNRRELIMPQKAITSNTIVNQQVAPTKSQPKSVKCQNCGATNTVVPGVVNECEYCGSPL